MLTNNRLEDPFLHSQLINLYADTDTMFKEKILFCETEENYFKGGFILKRNFLNTSVLKRFFLFYVAICKQLFKHRKESLVIHLRGVPASVFFLLIPTFWIRNLQVIFDPRGLFFENKKESYPKLKHIIKAFELVEKYYIKNASIVIAESVRLKNYWFTKYGQTQNIITCYNASSFELKESIPMSFDSLKIVYCGSVNHWHDIDEIVRVFKHLNLFFKAQNVRTENFIFSQRKNHEFIQSKFNDFEVPLTIDYVPYALLEDTLKTMDIGVSVVKPLTSTVITSPIKIADYIFCDLLMVMNKGIGDFDDFFIENNSAFLYDYEKPLILDKIKLAALKKENNLKLKSKFCIVTNKNKVINAILALS